MFLGLDIKIWLGLSVLGATVSTVGALLGILLKEYFLTRSLEQWKQKQSLEQVYEKFRAPLMLAARELVSRTLEVLNHYPTVYLRKTVLASSPEKQVENTIEDAYFQRYKLISTIYRISAFLGWIELYRQEITFLHSGNNKHAKVLEETVDRIRSDLADGQLNQSEDWQEWRDTLVFREELRAIGESLIEHQGDSRSVMGYGRYCECLESDTENDVKRWSPVLFNFYLDLEVNNKDFRQVRLERLFVHVTELVKLLGGNTVLKPYMQKAYNKYKPSSYPIESNT